MFIPLRVDVPTDRLPVANIVLMTVIVIISMTAFQDAELFRKLAGVGEPEIVIDTRGIYAIPQFDPHGLPLYVVAVTSLFLHGGWLHLLANMLFMWVFGSGVNYKFGQLGHIALFLLAGFFASMTHYAMTDMPVVGASGAIYGLMGAFLVYFCRNDITIFWVVWIRPGVSTLSSGWIILLWVGLDLFSLVTGSEGMVAIWAHLSGFLVGVLWATVMLRIGWVKPTRDEQSLYEVIGVRAAWARAKVTTTR